MCYNIYSKILKYRSAVITETFVNTVTKRKVALEEKRNELKEKMSKRKEKGRTSILFAIISLSISIALFFVLPKIFEFNP